MAWEDMYKYLVAGMGDPHKVAPRGGGGIASSQIIKQNDPFTDMITSLVPKLAGVGMQGMIENNKERDQATDWADSAFVTREIEAQRAEHEANPETKGTRPSPELQAQWHNIALQRHKIYKDQMKELKRLREGK